MLTETSAQLWIRLEAYFYAETTVVEFINVNYDLR